MNLRQNTLVSRTLRTAATGSLFAVLLGVTQSAAHAAVPLLFVGANNNYCENVQISLDGGATYQNVAAGEYTLTLGSGSSAATLSAFCVDYSNNINPGDKTTATLNDITGANGLVTAKYNTGSAYHTTQANANAVAYLIDKYLTPSVTKQTAAEVNIAIWDIVNNAGNMDKLKVNNSAYNSDIDMTQVGKFITAGYGNTASNLVDWVQTPKLSNAYDSQYQDFGIHGSDGQPFQTPQLNTPEPGMVQLGGVSALGVLGSLLRRRKVRSSK